jgi:hypothetical protein
MCRRHVSGVQTGRQRSPANDCPTPGHNRPDCCGYWKVETRLTSTASGSRPIRGSKNSRSSAAARSMWTDEIPRTRSVRCAAGPHLGLPEWPGQGAGRSVPVRGRFGRRPRSVSPLAHRFGSGPMIRMPTARRPGHPRLDPSRRQQFSSWVSVHPLVLRLRGCPGITATCRTASRSGFAKVDAGTCGVEERVASGSRTDLRNHTVHGRAVFYEHPFKSDLHALKSMVFRHQS